MGYYEKIYQDPKCSPLIFVGDVLCIIERIMELLCIHQLNKSKIDSVSTEARSQRLFDLSSLSPPSPPSVLPCPFIHLCEVTLR